MAVSKVWGGPVLGAFGVAEVQPELVNKFEFNFRFIRLENHISIHLIIDRSLGRF